MIKDAITANESVTPNDREIAILKEHFPACFKEDGSFDIGRFREFLSDKVHVTSEGYELKFLGKNYARLLASIDTTTVIQPDEEHNAKPENASSKNIYISGDNLDALKHLLKSYVREIKCIYIDPPYNTGKDDFIYNDKFNYSVDELVERLSIDEGQARRILDITKRGSASHSAWLMFVYPRLLLARDIIKNEGVILISVDDNEISNLRLLCDDIFGEENHVGTIIWNNVTDNNPTNVAVEHEYVVVYARNKEKLESSWKLMVSDVKNILLAKERELLTSSYKSQEELQAKYKAWYTQNKSQLGKLEGYKNIDDGGIYAGSRSVHNPGKRGYYYDIVHPTTGKACVTPLMGYRFPEETMRQLLEEKRIIFGEDETKIIELKQYVKDYFDKLSSVISIDGRSGANIIRSLFDNVNVFKNPKTPAFLEELLSFTMGKNDTVLDFFAGSSTTAHAIFNLNIADGGHRQFIIVQLQEACKKDSEAKKAGFETIDQIGIERIIRAAKAIKEANPDTIADLGFKHFTLLEPSSQTLDRMYTFEPEKMFADEDILKQFGKPTVLATWLNYDGYGLNSTVETLDLGGYPAYYCGKHLYLVDPEFNEDALEALMAKYESDGVFSPDNVVLFGYSFVWRETDMLSINLKRLKDTEKNLRVNLDIRY